LGGGLYDPTLHGVGKIVSGDSTVDVIHDEEGTPIHEGSSSYHPTGQRHARTPVGQGLHYPVLQREVGVEEQQVLVGAIRTTRRWSAGSPPSRQVAVHKIVSLENPLEAGALTLHTVGSEPAGSLVASQRESESHTSAGSR